MAPSRIAIDGDGPLAVQLLRQLIVARLLERGSYAPVAVRVAGGPSSAPRLRDAIADDGTRLGPQTRVEDGALRVGDLRIEVLSPSDPWPAHDRVVVAGRSNPCAAHGWVVARLVDLVPEGAGLRWLMLTLAGHSLPAGLGAAIHRARPRVAGKISLRLDEDGAARTLLRMSWVEGAPTSVEGFLDRLREAASEASESAALVLLAEAPTASRVLSRPQVAIDGAACRVIGSLIELEAHYDALALEASLRLAESSP